MHKFCDSVQLDTFPLNYAMTSDSIICSFLAVSYKYLVHLAAVYFRASGGRLSTSFSNVYASGNRQTPRPTPRMATAPSNNQNSNIVGKLMCIYKI